MAETETTRLCRRIVLEHFGDIPARVSAELLSQGRLPLLRICRSTLIKPPRVANALLVLIQHNIVWHREAPGSGTEIFEMNVEETLSRLRYGRYLLVTEDIFGASAVSILSYIMDNGKVRAGDIVSNLVLDPQDYKSQAKYNVALTSLLKEGYIKPTSAILHISPQDRIMLYEEDAEVKLRAGFVTPKPGPLAAKDIASVKEMARIRYEVETLEIETSGIKRKPEGALTSSKSHKRPKIEEDVIDEDLYLRVNPDKYNIHIRNQIFTASASETYNKHAGSVLSAALTASLSSERTPNAIRSSSLSFHTISRTVPSSAPPLRGLHLPKSLLSTVERGDNAGLRALYVKEWVNKLVRVENPSSAGRVGAFMAFTLATGGGANGGGGGGGGKRVSVEYDVIAKRLRALVLDNVVRDKWGDAGIRIIKILRDCGKLDGEQIAKRAMLKKVDVQKYLKDMGSEGLVSSIELPRSADRIASRSVYLWWIDTPRTYASLLFSLYRTLGNILSRLHEEQSRMRYILDKRARSDVQANEEQYITRDERVALDAFFERRERMNVLVRHVDESAFVLSDLAKGGYLGDDPYTPNLTLHS